LANSPYLNWLNVVYRGDIVIVEEPMLEREIGQRSLSNPEQMELKRDEFRKLQYEDMTAVVRRYTWGAPFLSTNMDPRIHH
jgi:hypothetical protein